MAAQAVIGGTVHTPLAQDVSGRGGTQLHPQHAVAHAVVHFGDLWPGLIGMGNQLQLYDPGPLDVLVAQLVGRHRLPLEHDGACDPGDDEIPELLGLPVEGADVPAQTVVDQRERDDLPLGAATGDGVVLDAERTLLVDRPGHARQHIQIRMREP